MTTLWMKHVSYHKQVEQALQDKKYGAPSLVSQAVLQVFKERLKKLPEDKKNLAVVCVELKKEGKWTHHMTGITTSTSSCGCPCRRCNDAERLAFFDALGLIDKFLLGELRNSQYRWMHQQNGILEVIALINKVAKSS